MNRYRVEKDLYKYALVNKIKESEYKITILIQHYLDKFKKHKYFLFKRTDKEIIDYSKKLYDENYYFNLMNDEFDLTIFRCKISDMKDKIEALDLVQDKYFEADDETLLFIQAYSQTFRPNTTNLI